MTNSLIERIDQILREKPKLKEINLKDTINDLITYYTQAYDKNKLKLSEYKKARELILELEKIAAVYEFREK